MPLMNVPSQQIVKAEKDFEPAPEIDPNLEIPLLEAQIEAMFRAPEPEDFVLPPALSEHAKGKTMVAQNLPKQSDIDKLMKQLNRKIPHKQDSPHHSKTLKQFIATVLHLRPFISSLGTTSCLLVGD